MKNYPVYILVLFGACFACAEPTRRSLTLEYEQMKTEPRADIFLSYDSLLLQMQGEEMQKVRFDLALCGYREVSPDFEIKQAAGHFLMADCMNRCVVMIPPAHPNLFCVLYFCWNGKEHLLDSHSFFILRHEPGGPHLFETVP